jgi:hypothetical protein
MHRGFQQEHKHDHRNDGDLDGARPGPGHNHAQPPRKAAQWQTPHLVEPPQRPDADAPDLDLVEAAFIEGFNKASDPTSFLRLARVPFEARAADGAKLALLRVETDEIADMGTVMPHLGGETFRYDPLPAALVARRRQLHFIYFDGKDLRRLNLAEVATLGEL